MTNDLTTVEGSLQQTIDDLETNLQAMGVNATFNSTTGIRGLIARILDITGSVGGLIINTSFDCNISSNIIYLGSSVTISGKLDASFNDTSETDDDLIGVIQHGTVKIYNGENLLGSVQTDNSGNFSFTYTPLTTGSLSLKAVYESSVYIGSQSSNFNVVVNELMIDDIVLSTDKSILSYADNEYATLTAQLQNEGSNVSAANVSVDFNIYDDDDNLIDTVTGTTNSSGQCSVSYHAHHTGDISIVAYVSNTTSNTVNIEDCLFAPKLDGTDSIYQITGNTTVSNGVMSGGSGYFSTGWDNTLDWELTMDMKINSNSGILVYVPTSVTSRDTNEVMLVGNNAYRYINRTSTLYSITNKELNTWYSVTVRCENGELSITRDNLDCTIPLSDLSNYNTISCGVDSWGGTASIRNVKVKVL